MKKGQRILAILLAVLTFSSLLPAEVFAAEPDLPVSEDTAFDEETAETEETSDADDTAAPDGAGEDTELEAVPSADDASEPDVETAEPEEDDLQSAEPEQPAEAAEPDDFSELDQAEPGADATETVTETAVEEPEVIELQLEPHLNPLYEGLVSIPGNSGARRSLRVRSSGAPEEITYTTSQAEAAAVLRDGLKHRQSDITVYYQTDGADAGEVTEYALTEMADELFDAALAHTGVPTEGDYLLWVYWYYKSDVKCVQEDDVCYYTINYQPSYYTTAEQEERLTEAVDAVLAELDLDGKSDAEQVKAIYDYICGHVEYDYAHPDGYSLKHTAYAAMIDGTAVCQGYAVLFYRMALERGIDARVIAGYAGSKLHGWNIVRLGGAYYNLDATWDAGKTEYNYFLRCDENFPSHVRANGKNNLPDYASEAFYAAYPMAEADYVWEDPSQPHVHQYEAEVTEPTCTEEGYTTYTCAECGAYYIDDYTAALGHDFVRTETKPATYTEEGYTVDTCSRCGETVREVIPKLPLLATPAIREAENTLSGVRLTWDEVEGAEKYRVFRKTGTGNWTRVGDVDGLTLTDAKAVNGVKYTYTVRCITADGMSYSSNVDCTGKTITCVTIPLVSKLESGTDGVHVTWSGVIGAEQYRVFRKTGTGNWTRVGVTDGLTLTDKTAATGVTYTYTVRCITADGSTYTSGYDCAGKTITYLPFPVLVEAENVSEGGVRVTWNRVNGAEKYRVFRKTGNGVWSRLGDTTELGFIDTKALDGVTYTYTVRCISADGKSYISDYDHAGKTVTCIVIPQITRVENGSGGVQITWERINEAAKYRVFRRIGTGKWTRVGDTTGLTMKDTEAVSGSTYTYTVRCVSADGKTYTSSYDSTGKTVTYIAQPSVKSAENINGGVQITWGSVAGAAKYRLFRKTGSGSWERVGDTTGLTLTDKKAVCGVTYAYTVRCVSADGKSYTSSYDGVGKSITYLAPPVITALDNVAGGVRVTWARVSGAAKYRVFRKSGSGDWIRVGDTTELSLVDTKVPRETDQIYTVRCITSDGKRYTSGYDRGGKTISVALYSPPNSYSFSLAYRTSAYFSQLMSVQVGMDQRKALLDVAKSQLGYTEGNNINAIGGSAKGSRNYTEYGLWYYNYIDSGDSYYLGAWCSMFASWCANEAGIPTDVIPRRALVADMKDAFAEMGRYYTWKQSKCGGGNQEIRPGDLIIFSTAPLGRLSHIGIVSSVSDNGSKVSIHTIEGNMSDSCCEKTYTLSKSSLTGYVADAKVYIRGFACPDYND